MTSKPAGAQTAICRFCNGNFTRIYKKGAFRSVQVYCDLTCQRAWYNGRRSAARTTCSMKDCFGIAPSGSVKCPDCKSLAARARREIKANATYEDLTHLDTACYLCGNTEGPFHKDHVVPLARFAEYAEECEDGVFSSALRLACATCNLRKNAKHPAVFVLEQWQAASVYGMEHEQL